jgi:hypothetical protein
MAALIHKSPFSVDATTVEVRGRAHRVFPFQVLIWVSLGPRGLRDLDSAWPRFPAVLDPAFSETFLIHQQQLRTWAGLQPEHLRARPEVFRAHGRPIPVHAANLWLYRNPPGERDQLAAVAPFFVELPRGIGVSTDADLYPRLPLLGARALRAAELRVLIDYRNCTACVGQRRGLWPFG